MLNLISCGGSECANNVEFSLLNAGILVLKINKNPTEMCA